MSPAFNFGVSSDTFELSSASPLSRSVLMMVLSCLRLVLTLSSHRCMRASLISRKSVQVCVILVQGILSHSRLCEIKSFSGTGESLRTPFAEKCAGIAAKSVK